MHGNAPSPAAGQSGIGFNLSAIALALGALALGAAYLIDSAGRNARTAMVVDGRTVSSTLSGRELEIPAAWFRSEPGATQGFAKQIDLRLHLPLGTQQSSVPVDVTLLPRSRVRPSSSLLDGVYLHQFRDEQLSGPAGLVGKPLVATEGYEDETVWYDPLSAQPFVAKCSKPMANSAVGQCLRTVYLAAGVAAIYAFPEDVLGNWREFDGALNEQMKHIGAH